MNPQHDGLRNAAANVTIISPFYDAGLPVEYAANGFPVYVPHLADLSISGVTLLLRSGSSLRSALFWISPGHCTLRATSSLKGNLPSSSCRNRAED